MEEYPVEDQLIVVIRSDAWRETRGDGLSPRLLEAVATDMRARRAVGWVVAAYDTVVTRSTGTASSVLTNSGDATVEDVAITVVYRADEAHRPPTAPPA